MARDEKHNNRVQPMGLVVLLIVFVLLVLVILPIWVVVKMRAITSENEALQRRLRSLELNQSLLRQQLQKLDTPSGSPRATPLPTAASPAASVPEVVVPAAPLSPSPPLPATRAAVAVLPSALRSPEPAATSQEFPKPPITTLPPPLPRNEPSRGLRLNWEQFMGAKLMAWIGGLAGFLAVAYFVKYSFEHDLIPPEVRVAIGFVISAALVVGGLMMKPERFRITAQVLCAMGIVSLYAVTFACNAVYHFPFFGTIPTFLLMTLVTATAFLLAVRMNAQVVAILGLLGGFLTPVLLSTGHDNPGGLFGFIALLDAGLVSVALHRSWFHLVPLAAVGTVMTQIGWTAKFFDATKTPIAIGVCLGFCTLFFAATEIARRFNRTSRFLTHSSAALAVVAFCFAFFFLLYPSIGAQPGRLFAFLFAADLFLLALVFRNQTATRFQALAGSLAFIFLAIWTARHLTDELLPWALGAFLFFAVLHTAFPLWLQRQRPDATPGWWSQLYPPLALLLMLGPLVKSDEVSFLFWPALLLIDVVAVALALISASVMALGVVLVFTLAAMALSIFKAAGTAIEFGGMMWLIAGFSVFFFASGIFLARRLGPLLRHRPDSRFSKLIGNPAAQIPAFSALLPFALLIMISQRLVVGSPSALFGLGLLLCVMVLGLTRILMIAWLPLCGLIGIAALEFAWHARHLDAANAGPPLTWYVGFSALFAIFPFLFRRHFASTTGPWAAAALSGVVHFPLVYTAVRQGWPDLYPGLIALAFAFPPLLSVAVILRGAPADPAKKLNQLAWFGGVALLFITLIFPLQFDRQWITLSWALEGVALLWLYRRVPHAGLRATGVALLIIAFARLAVNPSILSYLPRSEIPIFNWYLYAYGIVVLCLFFGARLLTPPRERALGINAPPLLNALAIILTFLLLNIEIADYFTTTGSMLTFEFHGDLARDLAYTVGWALFALALLGVGIWKSARAARYAALALLSVTLLKLFFHDLDHLGQLYRVGALVVVAAVAILASFLYQRFTPSEDRSPPPLP